MFRDLDSKEEQEFKQWARDNYEPGTEVNTAYHPVVQAECELINTELEEDSVDMECSICEIKLDDDYGNNASPVNDGTCCDNCNMNVVIPARLGIMLTKNK